MNGQRVPGQQHLDVARTNQLRQIGSPARVHRHRTDEPSVRSGPSHAEPRVEQVHPRHGEPVSRLRQPAYLADQPAYSGDRPAYFEDNDYFVRVAVGGGECRAVHGARFYHHGSMTIRLDPEAGENVRHWFGTNRGRFAAKWGTGDPPASAAEAKTRCHPHPWNDPALPVSFWDRD